jgi:hypothetical protein
LVTRSPAPGRHSWRRKSAGVVISGSKGRRSTSRSPWDDSDEGGLGRSPTRGSP